MIFIDNIKIANEDMRIDTAVESFDMQKIINRRFMFNPLTGTLILGRQYSGNTVIGSHLDEHKNHGEGEPYGDFIPGWVGTGGRFESGVIHFAPPISADRPELANKGFSALEMFAANGATGETVIRGFPDVWEQPLSGILDGSKISERKEVMTPMAEKQDFYRVTNYGDDIKPADGMKIERHIYFQPENADISRFTALPLERLQAMRDESAAAEQAIFDKLRGAATEWENQAAVTLLLDKAIEYVKTPAVTHSSNKWVKDRANNDFRSMSNMVYKMTSHVSVNTPRPPLTPSWDLTWSVHTNTPDGYRSDRIAGQDRKHFTDLAEMEKYLNGRIKAYSHLFAEISPPIPPEYAKNFRVNGQLLPGYTVEGEKPKRPDRAAEIENGGVSLVDQKLNELLKESDTVKDILNIELSVNENTDGAWLKLPATEKQLDAVLARIGAQGKNYIISGIETTGPAFIGISLENAQKAGVDELNYFAARLEAFDGKQIEKLNAVMELSTNQGDTRRLSELVENIGCYDYQPDILSFAELGEYCIEKSGIVQFPEEWKGAIDREKLGRLAAADEKGIITEKGYIVPNGAEWKYIAEIPKEFQIAPKFEVPEIDFDSAAAARTPAVPKAAVKPIVLVSDSPRDRMKEITQKLEAGIKGIFDSEQYKTYLQTLSKFHNYSFNNCILIAMQKPDASHIAGFNDWRDKFKRPVMKGEKGIKIFAPAPFKTKKTVDAVDADGKPVYDNNGQRAKMETEITVPAYKIVSVFDVSQTDGEPLPHIGVDELAGSVDRYRDFFAALEKTSNVPISFEAIPTGAKGYYHQEDKRIAINGGMSELQNLKTAIHEIAHSRLHAIDTNTPVAEPRPDRRTREVEAESIAYVVCQHYGLDTSDYSFGYVATWSGDKQLDALKASLDTIRKEADAIITEVDKHFAEITQDKEQATQVQPGHEKWSEPATRGNAPDDPGEPSDDVNAYLPQQGDTFTIYQLKDGEQTKDLRFEPLAGLTAAGLAVALVNYDKAYTAPLDKDMTLEKIFFAFNMDKPEDFKGRSLSVSDVVVMNTGGKETAFYVDGKGFQELPGFLAAKEQEKPAPTVDLKAVADYMQKLNDSLQAVKPDSSMSIGAYNATIKRLEQANERITDNQPQLKTLITNAAQSPDFNTLKERMNTLQTEFTQHYSTAVQNTVDMSGKAAPTLPKETLSSHIMDITVSSPPTPKAPAYGENVAAIEAKVNAGETINLSALSDAFKKDKAAQSAPATQQTGKTVAQPRTASQGKGTAAQKSAWQMSQSQQAWDKAQGRAASKPAAQEKPSIREELAANKKQLAAQKPAPSQTKNKNAELGR